MPLLYRNNENTAFQPRAARWQSVLQGRNDPGADAAPTIMNDVRTEISGGIK